MVWTSKLYEADLILKVKVAQRVYFTDGGIFTCRVLSVEKGKYSLKEANFSMGMIEFSRQRWDKRYYAIWKEPLEKIVYIGFKKVVGENFELEDKKLDSKWSFFMSSVELDK